MSSLLDGLWNFFLIFGLPFVLWYTVGERLLAKWKTVRGVTGLKFVPKRPDQD